MPFSVLVCLIVDLGDHLISYHFPVWCMYSGIVIVLVNMRPFFVMWVCYSQGHFRVLYPLTACCANHFTSSLQDLCLPTQNEEPDGAQPAVVEQTPSVLGTVLMFITSFFTSLVPQRPPELAGN